MLLTVLRVSILRAISFMSLSFSSSNISCVLSVAIFETEGSEEREEDLLDIHTHCTQYYSKHKIQ